MPFANIEALTESISPLVISEDEKWISRVAKFAVSDKAKNLTQLQRDGATAVIDLAGEFALGRGGEDLELVARVIGRLSDIQVRDFALGSHTESARDADRDQVAEGFDSDGRRRTIVTNPCKADPEV